MLTFDGNSESLCGNSLSDQTDDSNDPDNKEENNLFRTVVVHQVQCVIVSSNDFIGVRIQEQWYQEYDFQQSQRDEGEPWYVV